MHVLVGESIRNDSIVGLTNDGNKEVEENDESHEEIEEPDEPNEVNYYQRIVEW